VKAPGSKRLKQQYFKLHSNFAFNLNLCRYSMVVDSTHLKMYVWYDNEYGYSARMVDIAKMLVAAM